MVKEEYFRIIKESKLFEGISAEEIKKMLVCLYPSVLSFKKNEYIRMEGDDFDALGLLLEGKASVSKEKASGERVVMTMIHEGDIFGEMAAFSDAPKWPGTVQCIDSCVILFIPKKSIIGECEKICSWHRTFIQNFIRIVSQRALMLSKKVEYLTIKSMRGKISVFLLDEYKRNESKNFIIHLNRNELADFLNVSRPSMSRELLKMKDEGIIDFHLSSFRIIDLERLKTFA